MKDKPHCSFVMAKNRLARIKTVSLPRLELNTAVLGIRLYKSLIKELHLPIYKTTFWIDSSLVLQYFKNEIQCFKSKLQTRGSSVVQCCHVPVKETQMIYAVRVLHFLKIYYKIKGINKNHGIKDQNLFGITQRPQYMKAK